ncbi:MAG: CDP-glucose 4,6-dehydratase, partial [Lachnospiraceae bacterium]|nr:CDP-glucose 4,6-dehydratase [Lachnospiraceae bacterium]
MREDYLFDFYKGKKVFVTGHTGFKGTWLCRILLDAGAIVYGYSMPSPTNPNLYSMSGVDEHPNMHSTLGDVRNLATMQSAFYEAEPEIVFHLAAQPIVRDSYKEPVYTYETNVMGTVHICECVRRTTSVRSFLNVTTDKVYLNREWEWGYREDEPLDGYDPYSNSKSCSELITHSYINSFFGGNKGTDEAGNRISVSTARAGNVIGGGDFSNDRIIPDCIRAMEAGRPIIVRNPHSTRPYQHVLEPLYAYLMIAAGQYEDPAKAGYYNVGPDDADCYTTGRLVTLFCDKWNEKALSGEKKDSDVLSREAGWIDSFDGGPHEAGFLKLDCSRLKRVFDWKPRWSVEDAMERIIDWTRVYYENGDIP